MAPRIRGIDTEIGRTQRADRLAAVQRVRQWPARSPERTAAIQAECERLGCSPSSLYKWISDYERSGADALQRKRRSDKGLARDTKTRTAWVTLCCQPRLVDLPTETVAKLFAAGWCREHGVDVPPSTTLRRWRAEIDPRYKMTPREAKRASQVKTRIVSTHANQAWIADQRTADLHVRVPIVDKSTGEVTGERLVRPFLFHFVDVHSGAEMGGGYYLHYDTDAVEAALLDSIYPDPEAGLPLGGTPEMIWWDHGRQHWSQWTREAARVLDIRLVGEKSAPGEPTHHGLIEGTHKIVKERFEALLPGYCAGETLRDERPLPLRLAADGHEEPDYITLDELNRRYRRWVADLLLQPYRRHGSTATTCRLDRWRATISPERRAVPDLQDLAWQWMPYAMRTVSAEGHIHLGVRVYTHPLLGTLKGLKVKIRYLRSSSAQIWVTNGHGDLLCIAEPVHDAIIGDQAGAREGSRLAALARQEVKRLRRAQRSAESLVGIGAMSAADAAALDQGADALAAVIQPGATVPYDIDRLAQPEQPESDPDIVQLHPRPGRKLLRPVDDRAEAAAELLAIAGTSAQPAPAPAAPSSIWE